MNKAHLKSYAPQACEDLIGALTARAHLLCTGQAIALFREGSIT